MLEPMEKDAAIEVISEIRASIYKHKKQHGSTAQLENDRIAVLDFKDKVRFEADKTTWNDILEFSNHWKEKYS